MLRVHYARPRCTTINPSSRKTHTHRHRHTKSLAAYLSSLKLQSSAMKALQSFVSNPNPNLCRTSSPSYQIYSPTIVRFDRFLRSSQPSVRRRGLALALDLGRRPNLSLSRSFVSHAASHEESVSRIQSYRLSILFHFYFGFWSCLDFNEMLFICTLCCYIELDIRRKKGF